MTATTTTTDTRTATEKNLQVVQDCYEAFMRGDIAFIMDRCADEGFVGFGVISYAARKAPWHFRATTKADVPKFFQALGATLEPVRFEPTHYAAAGDVVYATTQHEYRVRGSGKTLLLRDAVHRVRFVRGRIVEWWASEDTAYTNEVLAAS